MELKKYIYIFAKQFLMYLFSGIQLVKKDFILLLPHITEVQWVLCLFMTLLMKKRLKILLNG